MARPEEEEVWACRTFIRWSHIVDNDGERCLVRLASPRDPRLKLDFKYVCTCKDSHPCLHVSIAKGYHCGWHEVYDPEKMTDHGACPRCGSMAIRVPIVN